MVIFVLITSLDAQFMLAARALVAEHARARRGAAAARPEQCVERLANLPLLEHLASVVVRRNARGARGEKVFIWMNKLS